MARLNKSDSWLGEEFLTASLSLLREREWLWRNPGDKCPFGQRVRCALDPLIGRCFSKYDLNRGMALGGLLGQEDIRFAYECSAIEVNPQYMEAYVRRAIDGDTIFRSRGRVRRLEGWDRTGVSRNYDTDFAILDTLIALAIEPQLAWTMRANGMLLLRKARDLGSDQWLRLAGERLHSAAKIAQQEGNSEVLSHCRELLNEIETGKLR